MVDLGLRAYNHSFRIDPIVRSLMDSDFYKLLMQQVIFKYHNDVDVTFAVKNRTSNVHLNELIDEEELRDQLDHVRSLRFANNELIWLQGNTFYGQTNMFEPDYIEFLRTFQLPEYNLERTSSGQFVLEFPGKWSHTTMWEIPALAIINTLRNRHALRSLSKFELDVLYAGAKTKLWNKLQKLKDLEDLNLTDFGTRRRHDFLFQEWAVAAAKDALGSAFTGTSNALLAMRHGLEAKGTNAHEMPMVAAALCENDEDLKQSQYKVCKEWEEVYHGALLVALPDTFGTTQFLMNAPNWIANWTGFRFDSKPPLIAGEEAINWWTHRGCEPKTKLGIFSDGLDVENIIELHNHFYGRMKVGFGFGTLLTSDFRGCMPNGGHSLDPISLVCKVKTANGRPAVKLSDNFNKAMGNPDEIERYRAIFGSSGVIGSSIIV